MARRLRVRKKPKDEAPQPAIPTARFRDGIHTIGQQIELDKQEAFHTWRDITKYRNYAKGIHDVTLTRQQQEMLEGVLGNTYCDDHASNILEEHASRLDLQRVSCEDVTVQKWIDDFWQRSKIDDLQQSTHTCTLRDGNFCLHVDYDYEREKICIHKERWFDGYEGALVGYDTFGHMLYGMKQWRTPEGFRRVVYFDGYLARFNSNNAETWTPLLLEEDLKMGLGSFTAGTQEGSDPILIPYTDASGNPLHIPFVHFANPGNNVHDYLGSSIYSGGFIGAQDQINDIQYDMLASGRMNGYQRTWSKGFALAKINGKTVKVRTAPGMHYHSDSKDAAWGVLQAGSIDELIKLYETKVKALYRMTGTPIFAVTGNFPSGEAVYKLENPIRGRTKARQKRFASAWVEVIHRCIELANLIDGESLDEEAMLTANFMDAGDRDPLTIAMSELSFWQGAQAAVDAGLPLGVYLKIQGWGEKQAKGTSVNLEAEILKEQKRQETLQMKMATAKSASSGFPSREKGAGGANTATQNRSKPTPAQRQIAKKEG